MTGVGGRTTHPLTAPQRAIWFDQLLHPGLPLYNIGAYAVIDGPLDTRRFEAALAYVVAGNDAMRLAFRETEAGPVQVFSKPITAALHLLDFSGLAQAEKHAVAWLESTFSRPFDLESGSLFRFALCRISPQRHLWLMAYHHLITDGYGTALIVGRVAEAYRDRPFRSTSGSEAKPSYAAFIGADVVYGESERNARDERFWRTFFLEPPEPAAALPVGKIAGASDQRMGRANLFLARDLDHRLTALAEAHGVSRFHVFLAALYTYMTRAGNRDDVVIGLPSLNRSKPLFKQTVGMFAGVTPAWFRHGRLLKPGELFKAIRRDLMVIYRHQRFPISEIIRVSGAMQRGARQLHYVELSFENHDYDADFGGGPIEIVPLASGYHARALSVFVRDYHAGRDLCLEFQYQRAVFEPEEMEALGVGLKAILECFVQAEDLPLHTVPMLPAHVRTRILAWGRPETLSRIGLPGLYQRFAHHARDRGDACALVEGGHWLSYAELDRRITVIAERLNRLGVGLEHRVAICLPRSLALPTAVFAVHKCGGAYVPLDPDHPPARLAFVVSDAAPSAIIVDDTTRHLFSETNLPLISLDELGDRAIGRGLFRGHEPDAVNLAYLIYTSGSTGRPKGVQVPHGNVTDLLDATRDMLSLGSRDVWTLFHSYTFDFSVWELFGALCHGGRLVVTSFMVSRSPDQFHQLLTEQAVTVLNQTPAAFGQLLTSRTFAQNGVPEHLRLVVFGGEALDNAMLQPWYEDLGSKHGPRLVNMYGITETTVHVTHYDLSCNERGPALIGRPLSGWSTYVLDDFLQPLPAGQVGMLYVGGVGLARGYLNRADLTAERFIPDPFSETAGARLYQTGDLARYNVSGVLGYFGRADHQVKIRGFRIELGEIEGVINEHPTIAGAGVSIRRDGMGDLRLVAHVVAEAETADIRTFLAKRLPTHMIPSAIISVDVLPLTVNGKLDRKALAQLEDCGGRQDADSRSDLNPDQEVIAAIWCDLLERDSVGLHDDFFELGGHSLLATRAATRINEALGVEIGVRHVFEASTIAGLSELIATMQPQDPVRPAITRAKRSEVMLLSFAQERLYFLNQLVPDNPFYNMPFILRLTGPLDVNALVGALNAIVARHETLRTSFHNQHGGFVQRVHPGQELTAPLIDFSGISAGDGDLYRQPAEREAMTPFDLGKAPLIRALLLRLEPEVHILLVTIHHIVSDGWSMGVFVRELADHYAGHGRAAQSPPAVSYVDYAVWQRSWLSGRVVDRQMAYWKNQLRDLSSLDLPLDHPRPSDTSYRGGKTRIRMSRDLSEGLRRLSHEAGASSFMTLLTGFACLLARYSGQRDIALGSPIANRTNAGIEDLIGFFVNTQVQRIQVEPNLPFKKLLAKVRRSVLDAFAHQDLPFEHLVEELQPERKMDRNPLVQVMFALQNAPMPNASPAGLRMETLIPDKIMVRFDLECHLWEDGEGFHGYLLYCRDLFEPETVARMVDHFKNLLAGIVGDADEKAGLLPMLSAEERGRLVLAWNDTRTRYPSEQGIHGLFMEWAARTPDAIALSFQNQALSYDELMRRASRLAAYLRGRGVGPGKGVGIAMPRSAALVTGILAVLMAGGAYLPLDTRYPRERLAFMLEDAGVDLILTDRANHQQLTAEWSDRLVIRADNGGPPFELFTQAGGSVYGGTPAYLMYTSGSTGRPKGVVIPHRAVVRLVCNTHYLEITPPDVFLQLASVSFDAATLELWGPLLNGARLEVMPPEAPALDQLGGMLVSRRITLLWLTAGLFHAMVDERLKDLKGLRCLLAGGDVLSPVHVQAALNGLSNTRLMNGYGPTENTTFTTVHPIEQVPEIGGVPIGRPIANSRVLLLDETLQVVPIGVVGELYIGGDGLALNYLSLPHLTAERFVPDPYADDTGAGERLYRSGDFARLAPDGTILFVGRRDNEVKLRGYRVDPAEVEAVLAREDSVREAVVIVTGEGAADKRLAAFVTPSPQAYSMLESHHAANLDGAHVDHWHTLYEDTYDTPVEDLGFNISGWNSSYTGLPIPAEEMRQWVDHTVERIMEVSPKRVLEIGCGTGLLLSRIAPHCEHYVGSDFSETAIAAVERLIGSRNDLKHVRLSCRRADEFDGIAAGGFDCVVLNSIVQYFPNGDYLDRVVAGAVAAVRPGGMVFVGDVRDLTLLRAYHTSVCFHKAPGHLRLDKLARRVHQALVREEELLVDPAWFTTLAHRHENISNVVIRWKRGDYLNELSKFRYDVSLLIGEGASEREPIDWRTWDNFRAMDPHAFMARERSLVFGVRGIPNPRLSREMAVLAHMEARSSDSSVEQIRRSNCVSDGLTPETLHKLGADFGYQVDVLVSPRPGCYDVLFRKKQWFGLSAHAFQEAGDRLFTNHPRQDKLGQLLAQHLEAVLREKLPEFMLPAGLNVLPEMPLTHNGKIDRQALIDSRDVDLGEYAPPRSPTQEILSAIWCDVLARDRIGIYDDFFELGGHSLLATRVASRVRTSFQLDLPVRRIFECPTVAALGDAIDAMRSRDQNEALPSIEPKPNDEPAPLSFAQERMWFLSRLAPDGCLYNGGAGLELNGPLHLQALEAALNGLRLRHHALRTGFPIRDGAPIQWVDPKWREALVVLEADEGGAERIADRLVQTPFDLQTGPMFRVRLLRFSRSRHVLYAAIHHIISDGWTVAVFKRELGRFYDAAVKSLLAGGVSFAPLYDAWRKTDTGLQYDDFAYWQRKYLSGGVLNRQLDYWRLQLKDFEGVLELPTHRPRPAVLRFHGRTLSFQLGAGLTASLKAFSLQRGASLFMTLYAAFVGLLHRYSGQTDIAAGTPIANRNRRELEGMMGFFVNTLVLRMAFERELSFNALLTLARRLTLDAYAHQDAPFEKLVEVLKPKRDTSRSPLFQVMFALQNMPVADLEPLGLRVADWGPPDRTARFELTLQMRETGDHLSGWLEYNTDLFDETYAMRFVSHFKNFLSAVVNGPDRAVSRLRLLSDDEQRCMLDLWSMGEHRDAGSHPLARFHQHAIQYGDRTALCFEGRLVTYRELLARSSFFAERLRSYGIGPERLVGVCLNRSIEMVVAMLGVFQAGGVYVPLDPGNPISRLAGIVADAGIDLLVSDDQVDGPKCKIHLNPGPLMDGFVEPQPENEPPRFGLGQLAYVIYTSGSTGTPKGVAVSHDGLANLALSQGHYYALSDGSRVLQFASFGFDASICEVTMALHVGAPLCLARSRDLLPGPGFIALLNRLMVTHAILPPSVLSMLAPTATPYLLSVISAGEACSSELAAKWSEGRHFVNAYGPTEATVWSTAWQSGGVTSLSLGRPLPNLQTLVLDRGLELVPAEVPGELFLGGVTLARGYLGEAAKTAWQFVPNPFGGAGSRLYRTGDLVKWLPDGNLAFIGRVDRQVKLRGFRLEPGEIEAVLRGIPEVGSVLVTPRHSADGEVNLTAYVTMAKGSKLDREDLRGELKRRLPVYMVPTHLVVLAEMPLTPNGKIDLKALPAPEAVNQRRERPGASGLPALIATVWRDVLKVEPGLDDNFFDLGGHSLLLVRVQTQLGERLGEEVPMMDLFQYPTIRALAQHLRADRGQPESLGEMVREPASGRIAIIGMAGRLPGASDPDTFWRNLREGIESIVPLSDEDLQRAGVDSGLLNDPNYVKAKGVLADIDQFDADFFGISPREAELLDPQHRMFLEICWEAFERAGYDPINYPGAVGVYAGSGLNTYLLSNLAANRELMRTTGWLQFLIGNDKDFVPTRVSYKLNLKGPSMNVNTACSTSLVAVQLACRELLTGQCDMALAGGVTVQVPQHTGYLHQEQGVLSPDGHCRAFDAQARGTVGGSGAGVVLLKRLEDAQRDGDPIQAVILGAAANNDGAGKVGYTAPGIAGQEAVIRMAHRAAGVDPETITYMEAHGTATPLGDPIEVQAMTRAFGSARRGFCALGSVKTNLGHLDTAAGVASLMKSVLAMKHKQIPPSLHYGSPNPEIDFENSPFQVNHRLMDWEPGDIPRRCGVSAFGIGGTNAHVVLEEAPRVGGRQVEDDGWQLLVLSAKTETALAMMAANLADHLEQNESLALADVAFTLQAGRHAFSHRLALICRDRVDAVAALRAQDPKRVLRSETGDAEPRVVFLFPGMGDQYLNMARGLYRGQTVFRQTVDRCASLLKPLIDQDITALLFDDSPDETSPSWDRPALDLRKMLGRDQPATKPEEEALNRTRLAHPLIFTLEYALAQLWIAQGVQPSALMGYSLGEYAAACIAGVLPLERALELVAARAELIDRLPEGVMLAVPLPESEITALLNDSLSLACVNTPNLCVVAGAASAVEALESQLAARRIVTRRLRTTHAFHSWMMEPARDAFHDLFQTIAFQAADTPYIANLTGDWATFEQITQPGFWVDHTCQTVRFADGLSKLLADPHTILLEVGPGGNLTSLAMQHPAFDAEKGHSALSCLRNRDDGQPDEVFFLNSLARLWQAGVSVDWSALHQDGERRRVELPTYPFERKRYWVDPSPGENTAVRDASTRLPSDRWLYAPNWRRTAPLRPNLREGERWLIFADGLGFAERLAAWLRAADQQVTLVGEGDAYRLDATGNACILPGEAVHYNRLTADLYGRNALPQYVVYLPCLVGLLESEAGLLDRRLLASMVDSGFHHLLHIARAIGANGITAPIRLAAITQNMQSVTGNDAWLPQAAPVLGATRVIPTEYPNITCLALDLEISGLERFDPARLVGELTAEKPAPVVAFRGDRRWVQCFEPIEDPSAGETQVLRSEGVYLITGGLGGIGLGLARYLAENYSAGLILLGRNAPPAREDWDVLLSDPSLDFGIRHCIESLAALEQAGSDYLTLEADVTDEAALEEAVRRAIDHFGAIHGVFHVAGVPGGGLIQLKTEASAQAVMGVKLQGTLNLVRNFQNQPLDFMALFSSNTAILGEVGQVDYCAANAFLDAFAVGSVNRLPFPITTVNWDAWQWDNWQRSMMHALPELYESMKRYREKYGLSFTEGAEVLCRALACWEPRVIVSTRDFESVIAEHEAQNINLETLKQAGEDQMERSKHQRPNLNTPYAPPENETEEAIVTVWQELLGIEPIGVHDNFFQLGGHSLLGIQVVSRLRELFQVEVPLKALFDAPTVADLTALVEEIILLEVEGLDEDQIDAFLESRETEIEVAGIEYVLPNGLSIQHLNKAETDHFYHDIFEDKVYYRNGIHLKPGDIVFDVGSNIGLFTLFASKCQEDLTIYSFEPAPPLFQILQTNAARHGVQGKQINCGISKEPGDARFTFYPRSTGMSTFHADLAEERDVLTAIMNNQREMGMAGMEEAMAHMDVLMEERFVEHAYNCRLRPLSDVMAEEGVTRIDLLKVDVQKAELDVLLGLDDADWHKVRQIVLEAHDIEGRVDAITGLLRGKGYQVTVVQDPLYKGSNIYNLYAIRP